MRFTVVIIGALALACTADVEDVENEVASTPPEQARAARSLESLAALGYSDWDDVTTSETAPTTVDSLGRVQPWPRAWANDRNLLHVIDIDGTPQRTITVPRRTQVEFARFLRDGRIACVSVDEGLTLLEPDGSLVWHHDVACHHDVAVVPDGQPPGERTFALAVHDVRDWRGREVRFDSVTFVDERTGLASATRPAWNTLEHRKALMGLAGGDHPLDRQPVAPPADPASEIDPAATTYDYFHLNSIAFDGSGTMIVCLRNIDLIAWIDLASGAPEHGIGPGVLDWPHAPALVQRGASPALLAFDNGYHRGWSRAVEIDPVSGARLWEYRGTAEGPLFSAVRGYVQRLPNGNTLITESERGRALEVTDDGEIVWEFWNPETREAPAGRMRRRIYRMTAIPPLAAGAGRRR